MQKLKFLQLNLGRGEEAQNLLMQTAWERRADVLLISEQRKWSKNSAWYQDASRKAGILVCSPDLSIGELVSVRDSARLSALTYAMRSIPRGGTSASRRRCGKRFQTTCCE